MALSIQIPGSDDFHYFNEGKHYALWEKLGAHLCFDNGVAGTWFAVWAPNAECVSVVGDFNHWTPGEHPLNALEDSGIWGVFIPGIEEGALYKYHLRSKYDGYEVDKADPHAFMAEPPPRSASKVVSRDYDWGDKGWMGSRSEKNKGDAPWSIYEMHLGSWMRDESSGEEWPSYRDLAPKLSTYIKEMGFTHVEFMPVMEHPFYGSWGYQVTGFYAPSARYGSPADFKFLIDHLHQNDIGVILDWVPAHFPTDEHGLGFFDGTHLYEHQDPRLGFHPDWKSAIFNYGRNEVQSFLISSALFWLSEYHVDGLRVDGVASMLYLDYSRPAGEWIPNEKGGRENLDAIRFLRHLNEVVYERFPDVQTIAEESTAWPMVSRPTDAGGLGFGMKWDMGWMHDTLSYFQHDPIHRRFHHSSLTFRALYAFNENFALPLSHDEVVHGKGSLFEKMAGDEWQKFANLRLLYSYMWAQPGKKMLFMGSEFGQRDEWNHDAQLPWHLLDNPRHQGLKDMVRDLNEVYREMPALHTGDFVHEGFQWVDGSDADNSVISFLRREPGGSDVVLAIFNFTPVPRNNYWVGVPQGGFWREIFNSDSSLYGGTNVGNLGGVMADDASWHGFKDHLTLNLPPLGAVFLQPKWG